MKCNHSHKVNETRKRSLLKAFTGYIFEVIVDTLIIGTALSIMGFETEVAYVGGFVIAGVTEVLCFLSHYVNDRLWNKVQLGREVEDVEETNTGRVEQRRGC